jgi:predicted N-acetyltransferase YhbS
LRLWPIRAGKVEALLLGPLAVAASEQHLGHGRKLISQSLRRAFHYGHTAVLLVGDAPFYKPFGFDQKYTKKLCLPGPVDRERFLGLELINGSLQDAEGLVEPSGMFDTDRQHAKSDRVRVA